MKALIQKLKSVLTAHPEYWYILFVPCYLICFSLLEHIVPSDGDYWVSWLPLDDKIPFVEIFIIPYCAWYPLLLGVGLYTMFQDVPEFRRYMHFLILGFGFSLLFCLLFPNGQNLRPAEFPRVNIFTRAVGWIYAADTNTNVLPSMHVVGCGAAVCCVFHTKSRLSRLRWPVLALSVLICVSTVLIKQHSVLDLGAGLVLCIPIALLLYRHKPQKNQV